MLIAELGLAPATKRALRMAGVERTDQLQRSANTLLAVRPINGAMLYDIVCRLHAMGLSLHTDPGVDRPSDGDLEILRMRVVEGLSLHTIAGIFDASPDYVRKRLYVSFGLSGEPPAAVERRRRRLLRRPEWERIIALRLCRAEDRLPLAILLRGFADGPLGHEARAVIEQMKAKGLLTLRARWVRPTETLCRQVNHRDRQGNSLGRARRVASRPL